jgi:putative membrane-bound dehydrogenase-like protein
MNRWRLVWLLCVTGLLAERGAAADDERGFRPLFDGQTLRGWKGDETFWRVEEGALVAESTPERPCRENTFLVWDQGEVDDFELRLEFRITGAPNANSGIQFRGQAQPDGHVIGYQADIDRGGQWVGALYDELSPRKLLAARGERTVIAADGARTSEAIGNPEALFQHVRRDDWNEYHILAQGSQLTLRLNGHTTAEVVDHQPGERDVLGKLALQLHSGPPMKVEFRNIRMKRLPLAEGYKKAVFIAGTPSHGYFSHEHNAGCLLLAQRVNAAREDHGLPLLATVYTSGWPSDPTALDNADTVISYCDGGERHPVNARLEEVDRVMARGTGLVCLHYAVEVPKGPSGDHFLKWIGGYFEAFWSVNPHWTGNFDELPEHPITRGVQPFEINDEWYYHMRFVPEMAGVTPILTDLPPRETLNRQDGHHSGNPFVREAVLVRREPQHVAWAYDRPGGGRGFGFTGGHNHINWQNDDFRKVVLNAIAWTAGVDVPAAGVVSATPTQEEMEANQDEPKPERKVGDARSPDRGRRRTRQPVAGNSPRPSVLEARPTEPVAADLSRAAADAIAQLDVHPELQATLFAAEPMLQNPTNIDIDPWGRVWVCEAVNYRRFRNGDLPERTEGDRILILEDTDADGRADRSTTFYQGRDVDSAHGICVLATPDGRGTRAVISVQENVFFLIDDDGDLKADRKELLFTGIGGKEHDHGIHAFVFGPDGKLYFNFGNEGKQIRNREGRPIIDKAGHEVAEHLKPYQMGMVFRCNLDGSEFETLGWNFRNNWELCVDSYGGLWQSDNDDDGNRGTRINFVMEYGNFGYRDELTGASWQTPRTGWHAEIPLRHWHLNDPGVVPNLLQTGAGSPTGICLYEGTLLPEIFHNQLLHCDAGPNVVRAYVTSPDGAGYRAEMVNILVGTRDQWFRPSDVCVAPDGSVIVADWYDPGVGGHRMGDVERGRLFRLTPRSASETPYRIPEHEFSTPEGAVTALQSPNLATRYVAWTALQSFGEKAVPPLDRLWKSGTSRMRARALWAVVKLGVDASVRIPYIRAALQDHDADLRATACRVARQLRDEIDVADLKDVIDLHDSSPAVRREMLIGLRETNIDAVMIAWAELARRHDGQDRWYLEALGIGADGRWDAALRQWLAVCGHDRHQPAGRDIIWRSRSERTPRLLAELIRHPSTPADELPRLLRAFDFQDQSQAEPVLEELAFATLTDPESTTLVNAEAFARLDRLDLRGRPEVRQALDRVLDNSRGNEQFVRLVEKFRVEERGEELLALAQQQPQSQLAAQAMQALASLRQQSRIRDVLHGDDEPVAVATLTALGTAADNRFHPLLEELMRDAGRPTAVRREAVRALGQSLPGAETLLAAAKSGEYDPLLKEALAGVLHAAQWRSIREPAAALFPLPPGRDSEPLPPLADLLARTGDIEKGRIVFHSTGLCHKCHIVNGLGREIGPNLSEIGKKLPKQALFESILYPSAGISHNYETWSVVTTDGLVLTGLLVNDTTAEIQIKDENALVHTVKAEQIELRQKQDVSLMPADLQKVMSAAELVDVIEYLTTLQVRTE